VKPLISFMSMRIVSRKPRQGAIENSPIFKRPFWTILPMAGCRVRTAKSFGRPQGTNVTQWLKLKLPISFFSSKRSANKHILALSSGSKKSGSSRMGFELRPLAFPPDIRPSKDGLNDAAHTRQGPIRIAEKAIPAK